MIASLTGTAHRLAAEEVSILVNGVGYRVYCPITVWDELKEGEEVTLYTTTYVREDRLDLFGFTDDAGRVLFERFIAMSGIGPKHALELSAVPKSLLMQAIGAQDPKLLTSVKGIGKKTAEKLLVDLKALAEKNPEIFGDGVRVGDENFTRTELDQDVIDALKNLGYDTKTILDVLQSIPNDLKTSEERVAAALRSI